MDGLRIPKTVFGLLSGGLFIRLIFLQFIKHDGPVVVAVGLLRALKRGRAIHTKPFLVTQVQGVVTVRNPNVHKGF